MSHGCGSLGRSLRSDRVGTDRLERLLLCIVAGHEGDFILRRREILDADQAVAVRLLLDSARAEEWRRHVAAHVAWLCQGVLARVINTYCSELLGLLG